MPLHVTISAVSYEESETPLHTFYIGRMEDLKKDRGQHRYSISPVLHPWDAKGEFFHEYADGANVCTKKALSTISDLVPFSIPEEPLKIQVDMAGYYTADRKLLEFYVNKDSFPGVDNGGNQRYGIYYEVWPFEPVAEFVYAAKGNLAGCIMTALETIEGNHHGKE